MHDSPRNLKRQLITLAISVGVVTLTVGVSVAFASLIFSGTGITGDSNSTVDATGTITIGASQATGITIGRSGQTTTFPGNVSITGILNGFMQDANNLSDLTSTSTARIALGLNNLANALQLIAANNLSDLTSTSSARSNLGLGSAATQNTASFLQASNNLSDLTSTSTARTNLGFSAGNNISISATGTIGLATSSISQFVNDAGYVTSTSGGTSQWTTTSTGISYGGNVTVGSAVPQTLSDACPIVQSATSLCVRAAPYYASGSSATTTISGAFTAGASSGPVASCSTFSANQGVYIAGAGISGANYIGTIVSCSGTTLTVTPAISTSVSSGAIVQHDETNAFQSAITALSSTGGTIYVPNGIYNLNGPLQAGANAVLVMPNVLYGQAPTNVPPIAIDITGATRPTGGTLNGTILQTAQTSGNLLGGYYNAGAYPPMTNVWLGLSNLTFRSYQNPSVTMVNANWIASLTAKNLWFDTGYPGGFQSGQLPTTPTHSNGVALALPINYNDFNVTVDDVTTYGYYTGIAAYEHTHISSAYAMFDYNGFQFIGQSGNPNQNSIQADYLWCQGCTNTIASSGGTINLSISQLDSEAPISEDIYDPNNYLVGPITIRGHLTHPFVLMTGGANLVLTDTNHPFPPLGNLYGWVPGTFLITPSVYVLVAPAVGRLDVYPFASIPGYIYSGYTTSGLANFTGRAVSARVFPAINGADTYLMMGLSATQWVAVSVDGGNISLNNHNTLIGSRAYSATTDQYWRLRESSGTIYADTSADGQTWVNLATTTVAWSYTTAVQISLTAGTASSITYPGYAEFDRLNVQ